MALRLSDVSVFTLSICITHSYMQLHSFIPGRKFLREKGVHGILFLAG